MLTETMSSSSLHWKHLNDDVFVTHFSSTGSGRSQIYVKKIQSQTIPVKRRLFLLHDLSVHHGRFRYYIEWMRKHSPETSLVMMDFSGHGLSSGTRGHVTKFDELCTDVLFLLDKMQSERAGERWIISGHGLGALVTLDLFHHHQEVALKYLDGMILSNFIIKTPPMINTLEENILSLHPELKKFGGKVRPVRINHGSAILSDPGDVLFYEHDPLIIHRPTLNTWREIKKKMDGIYQASYFLEKPMLILKSEFGDLARSQGMDRFAMAVKKDLLTEKKYSNLKHDLYNEIDREIVFNDILNWIKKYES